MISIAIHCSARIRLVPEKSSLMYSRKTQYACLWVEYLQRMSCGPAKKYTDVLYRVGLIFVEQIFSELRNIVKLVD